MRKHFFLLLLFPVLSTTAVPSGILLHVDTYKVDTAASKIEWTGEKLTGKHEGTINISSGEIANNHGKLGGKFAIDMTTITVTDLSGDSKGKLERHLKSDDFFSVEKFPTSHFEITSIEPMAGAVSEVANFNVTGKLTIKGITNNISFPALIQFEGAKMTAKAELKVDRSKFDIRYRSKTFFADIGDKAISDEFILKLDIVASI